MKNHSATGSGAHDSHDNHSGAGADGEVESFKLLPLSEVVEGLRTSQNYKPNCALVVIDFLFRHG